MEQKINHVFKAQLAYKYIIRNNNAAERIAKLKALKSAIKQYEANIYLALQSDLRKSNFESAVTELLFIYGEIDYAIKNLGRWMTAKKIGKTLSNPFAKNRIYYEPKGVCLIIAPWNYPFQLTVMPLIAALAAGNTVIVKPSELTPQTSELMKKMCQDCFSGSDVILETGEKEKTTELLAYPMDHVFFTG
ncbi:MAG: aldehyde dehydrogenase family protein, partial [Pedobacter sp.]|nr:aldehyde dehydrogenase family protein [Pedobacter sp.]